jgi:alanyl-tRNA synthetase
MNTKYNIPFQSSLDIRNNFINFFKKLGHIHLPSNNIVPQNDPTLLFINAGMNQFKQIFLGQSQPIKSRIVNSQKCMRISGKHNDLEEVGRDGTHHTFFEMLGNWSFGDYYKKEIIKWSWQLLIEIYKIPKERLFVTVYESDDESHKTWLEQTDIEEWRILRFKKDNFWEMGTVGPCGPCTEIHFDTGDLSSQLSTYKNKKTGVNGTNQRYVEIWNLVFIQYERLKNSKLKNLEKKHVDTGAGLERLCAIIQNKKSNYETDLFSSIIRQIEDVSQITYSNDSTGTPHRVIADHTRAATIAIADGVFPKNEGRGYVIRRILRRAIRFSHKIGIKEAFLYKLVPTIIKTLEATYPETRDKQEHITQTIEAEEKQFLKTLNQGLIKLEKTIQHQKSINQNVISGEQVFLLHDTYGFPTDLTKIIAEEHGFSIDQKTFLERMQEQKQRARETSKFSNDLLNEENWTIISQDNSTIFCGHDNLDVKAKTIRFQEKDNYVYIILDKTPFYAEAGGQVGDKGEISSLDKQLILEVVDTFYALNLHIHKCKIKTGTVSHKNLQKINASVFKYKRNYTCYNHSATHLLHASLHKILGKHIEQKGSLVNDEKLRFDFSHNKALSKQELGSIENMVNKQIELNNPIQTKTMALEDAKKDGAMALFGEKYDNKVRVLSINNFSKELCGGTHARSTGEIRYFKIINETSVAAGIRRIEAITNEKALSYLNTTYSIINNLTQQLQTPIEQIESKIYEMNNRIKEQQKIIALFEKKSIDEYIKNILHLPTSDIQQTPTVQVTIDSAIIKKSNLKYFMDQLLEKIENKNIILLYDNKNNTTIYVLSGKTAQKTINATKLLQIILQTIDGKGGGKKDRAQAGISTSITQVQSKLTKIK